MRISLLLRREPFAEILERTLTDFFQKRFNRSYVVKWWQSASSANPKSNSQIWLCNPYLNAILVPGVRKQVLLPVIQEFSRSTIWWRRPFQKIYVALATERMTCKWFARAVLEISPPLKGAENLLILGGNHHIRLLDYKEGNAFVIQKAGFDRDLLLNEIRVRRENPYLLTPRVQHVAEDGSWYSEGLILGTPLNRLKDPGKAKEAVRQVVSGLFQLYERTAHTEKISDYAAGIVGRIEKGVRRNPHFDQNRRKSFLKDLGDLMQILHFLQEKGDKEIVVSQTHGDFQPANILLGERHTWLIDWEYTSRRQIAYDGLVYSLSSRFPRGLSQRVEQTLEEKLAGSHFLMGTWPFVEWSNEIQRRIIIALFLLEELDLKLKENSNSLFKCLDQGFRVFGDELEKSIRVLQRTIS